jgi:hypothetical protein
MTWFLLLGGVRPISELWRHRRLHPESSSDADQLARLTYLPAIVWVALFGLGTLGALAAGTWLLVV